MLPKARGEQMLHQTFDMEDATLVDLIEAKIVEGLAGCKSVSEIAEEIAQDFVQFDMADAQEGSTDS